MNIGILGAGGIAVMMAKTIAGLEEATAYAVASRDKKKAKDFADKWGFEKAYGSYEEMLEDPKVELVYVATPHSHHAAHIKICLEHGKNVLCEKAFTSNAKEAREVVTLAREKGLLLAEAIWPRYMPLGLEIKKLLDEGVIGKPCVLSANLSYPIAKVERIAKPELAGGALLDIGVYPLTFASMMFGDEIDRVVSDANITETGVDCTETINIFYKDGKMACLQASTLGVSDRMGLITGSKGFMVIQNINNFECVDIYDSSRRLIKSIPCPPQITGYEYELLSAIHCIEDKKVECPEMTHEMSIHMMELMDSLRAQWGVRFPWE